MRTEIGSFLCDSDGMRQADQTRNLQSVLDFNAQTEPRVPVSDIRTGPHQPTICKCCCRDASEGNGTQQARLQSRK
jgi:hypothetical protein